MTVWLELRMNSWHNSASGSILKWKHFEIIKQFTLICPSNLEEFQQFHFSLCFAGNTRALQIKGKHFQMLCLLSN